MLTAIGCWISVESAVLVELRRSEGEDWRVSRLFRGKGDTERAVDEKEPPGAFYFRVLDAIHYGHRILLFGCDGARYRLLEAAERYSFMNGRIDGAWRHTDSSAVSIRARLAALLGGMEDAGEHQVLVECGAGSEAAGVGVT